MASVDRSHPSEAITPESGDMGCPMESMEIILGHIEPSQPGGRSKGIAGPSRLQVIPPSRVLSFSCLRFGQLYPGKEGEPVSPRVEGRGGSTLSDHLAASGKPCYCESWVSQIMFAGPTLWAGKQARQHGSLEGGGEGWAYPPLPLRQPVNLGQDPRAINMLESKHIRHRHWTPRGRWPKCAVKTARHSK